MIDKILIAEDHESSNISLQRTVEILGIPHADYVYYCDDALQKIKNAIHQQSPYDLLITDLWFDDDGRPQTLLNGMELINAARKEQPALKVLVFSGESKPVVINNLYQNYGIDGFVRKARHDASELQNAITHIARNEIYQPRPLRLTPIQHPLQQISEYDITLIRLLSEGVQQKQIPDYLKKHQIKPSGLSSVEKRLNITRQLLGVAKNEQLIAYCKDMGII